MATVDKSAIIPAGKRVGQPKHAKAQNITKERLRQCLPKGSSHEVTDRVMELIHNAENDTGLEQHYLEEQFLSHTSIMKQFKVSLEEYVNAVKYVSLVGNLSNRKAWEIVFPDRLAKAEAKIAENKEKEARGEPFVQVNIDSHVSNYNKTPLVVELRSRVAVAFDVIHAPLRTWALMQNVQLAKGIAAPTPDGEMMVVTPTVQQAALDTILRELKPDTKNKMEVQIGMSDEVLAAQNNIAEQMRASAEQMRLAYMQGADLNKIQQTGIVINAEVGDE